MSRFHSYCGAAALFALLALVPLPVTAQDPAMETVAQAEILPGWRTPDGRHISAIKLRLAPGWKTYWRAPGDTGIPPQIDWSGSRNVASVRLLWPRPKISVANGIQTIGYTGEVIWPLQITAENPDIDMHLQGRLDIGVCAEVCLPISFEMTSGLPVTATGQNPAISAALQDRPATAQQAGVRQVTCEFAPISDGLRITARIEMPPLGSPEVTVFELTDRSIWVSQATSQREGDMLVASADMVSASGAPFPLSQSDVRISVLGSRLMVEIQGCGAD